MAKPRPAVHLPRDGQSTWCGLRRREGIVLANGGPANCLACLDAQGEHERRQQARRYREERRNWGD